MFMSGAFSCSWIRRHHHNHATFTHSESRFNTTLTSQYISSVFSRSSHTCTCIHRYIMGSCSMLSAVWFPPQHRATATAVAYCGGSIGGALGFALGPLVVKNSSSNVETLLVIETIMAVVPFVACLAALPAAPRSGHAASAAVEVPTVALSLRQWFTRAAAAARNPSMLTLAGIAGVQAGVNSAWGGQSLLITLLLSHLPHCALPLPSRYLCLTASI